MTTKLVYIVVVAASDAVVAAADAVLISDAVVGDGGGLAKAISLTITTIVTSCRRAAATICPRPGLPVVTRYTSCTHMDRSPLLYVYVGLPVQPTKAAW